MDKRELLTTMQKARADWDRVITEIEPSSMTEPTMHGGWTVKDTVGHVAYYEQWVLHWLEDAVRGKVTLASHRDLLSVDERNALVYAENKGRALEAILAQSRLANDRLYQFVLALSEQDLFEPNRFERYIVPLWERSQPLWKCIAGDSFEHYAEHTVNLEDWLRGPGLKNRKPASPQVSDPVSELSRK